MSEIHFDLIPITDTTISNNGDIIKLYEQILAVDETSVKQLPHCNFYEYPGSVSTIDEYYNIIYYKLELEKIGEIEKNQFRVIQPKYVINYRNLCYNDNTKFDALIDYVRVLIIHNNINYIVPLRTDDKAKELNKFLNLLNKRITLFQMYLDYYKDKIHIDQEFYIETILMAPAWTGARNVWTCVINDLYIPLLNIYKAIISSNIKIQVIDDVHTYPTFDKNRIALIRLFNSLDKTNPVYVYTFKALISILYGSSLYARLFMTVAALYYRAYFNPDDVEGNAHIYEGIMDGKHIKEPTGIYYLKGKHLSIKTLEILINDECKALVKPSKYGSDIILALSYCQEPITEKYLTANILDIESCSGLVKTEEGENIYNGFHRNRKNIIYTLMEYSEKILNKVGFDFVIEHKENGYEDNELADIIGNYIQTERGYLFVARHVNTTIDKKTDLVQHFAGINHMIAFGINNLDAPNKSSNYVYEDVTAYDLGTCSFNEVITTGDNVDEKRKLIRDNDFASIVNEYLNKLYKSRLFIPDQIPWYDIIAHKHEDYVLNMSNSSYSANSMFRPLLTTADDDSIKHLAVLDINDEQKHALMKGGNNINNIIVIVIAIVIIVVIVVIVVIIVCKKSSFSLDLTKKNV